MGRYRAIMTDTDREYITADDDDVDSHKRYQAVSRVRNRITEELATDVELLEEHHPELLDELREIVCEDVEDGDIAESGSSKNVIDPVEEGDRSDIEAKEEIYEEATEDPDVDVSALVSTDDVPSSGREAEARRDAAVAVLALLQEYGEADTAALKDAAWTSYLDAHGVKSLEELEDVPLDTYADATEPERSLWNNTVLDVLKNSDHVEKRSDTERSGGYRWLDA